MKKILTLVGVLAAAALGPYFLFESDAGKAARNSLGGLVGLSSSEEAAPGGWFTSTTDSSGMGSAASGYWNANGADPQLDGQSSTGSSDGSWEQANAISVHSLREVLRFDISPNWVMQRFPRVSTVHSNMQLDGMRVPLITGTQPTDLAGTLTYYFDSYQRLQRVNVHAVTGDPSRFVAELQHGYKFQQQPALGASLYTLEWNGKPTSLVVTTPAPIIESSSPLARFNVFIELNQAGLAYGLSDEANHLVNSGKQAQRWH